MDSSVVGAVLTGEHLDMQRLAQNNEALSFDVKKILDNKSRIEGENFLLKKEIQRIRD